MVFKLKKGIRVTGIRIQLIPGLGCRVRGGSGPHGAEENGGDGKETDHLTEWEGE